MYLGIDLGTSAVKLVALREGAATKADGTKSDGGDLVQAGMASVPLTTASPHPYWSEQDPADWRAALVAAAADLRRQLGADWQKVRAIGLSGQMHGAVLLDAAHRVLRPAILWNDGRAHAEAAALTAIDPPLDLIAGVPALPGFTAPKLAWLARHEPALHARIAHILSPKDHIGLWLHGACVTDTSDAAGTWWLDQAARGWSSALTAATATDPAWLPPILNGSDTAGTLRAEAAAALGLPAGIRVVAGGGDAATGAVGLGAVAEGAAFLNLGTSGQLFVATGSYRPAPAQMIHAFAHTVPDMWYQMAAMLNGARPIAWFAGIANRPIPDLLAAAAALSGDRVPLFLPYLTGERSPHADPHIRGAFAGLEDATDSAAMMRAVTEAVAFSFADAADALSGAGTDIRQALATGGGAQSDLLLQLIADVTGIRIARAAGAQAGPASGAARLAANAPPARPLTDRHFDPEPAPRLRARLGEYRHLYRALKSR